MILCCLLDGINRLLLPSLLVSVKALLPAYVSFSPVLVSSTVRRVDTSRIMDLELVVLRPDGMAQTLNSVNFEVLLHIDVNILRRLVSLKFVANRMHKIISNLFGQIPLLLWRPIVSSLTLINV